MAAPLTSVRRALNPLQLRHHCHALAQRSPLGSLDHGLLPPQRKAVSGLHLARQPRLQHRLPRGVASVCRPCIRSQSTVNAIGSSGVPSPNRVAGLKYDALLVDAGGTLLETVEPVAHTYAKFGAKHGVLLGDKEIKDGFRRAFCAPWPHRLRYEGGGERFWRFVVAAALQSDSDELFRDLYSHFLKAEAWRLAQGSREALVGLRQHGVKIGLVSNWDNRLRPLLKALHADTLFDSIIISAEVGHEKPSPQIFSMALNDLGVGDPSRAVYLGDDETNDVLGPKQVGMDAWLWKRDMSSFGEIPTRILTSATIQS